MASTDEKARGVGELYVPAFDGIRGLVSLSIALVHIQLAVAWIPQHEWVEAMRASWFFSIEFLFLLGGFVAFLPLAHYRRFAGVRSYALRRAGRILPLYYVTVALAFAFQGVLRPYTGRSESIVPHGVDALLAHVVFIQHELYWTSGFGVQAIVWTMSIVACFYLLFPFIARAYLRWPVMGLATAIAISATWRTLVPGHDLAFLQFPLFLVDFAIGMSAAHIYVSLRRRGGIRPPDALAVAVCGLVALLGLLYLAGHPIAGQIGRKDWWQEGVLLSLAVPGTLAAVLVAAPFMPGWAQWPLSNRLARFIGQNAYGLFLFHFLVIWSAIGLLDIPQNGQLSSVVKLTVVVIPITVCMGWLGTRYIEDPIRDWAQRRAARLRLRDEAPPGAATAALPKISL